MKKYKKSSWIYERLLYMSNLRIAKINLNKFVPFGI